MCMEMYKADVRRRQAKEYGEYIGYFTGKGLDIGCGTWKMPLWPNTISIDAYDIMFGHKDAHHLEEIGAESYDFVVSSHCLEHMADPQLAFSNWLRVLKPEGHMVVTVPDWDMYERNQWPSKFNGDHKTAWTLVDTRNPDEQSNVPLVVVGDFLDGFEPKIEVVSIQWITANFDPSLDRSIDQTGGEAECAIEFIVRKL